MIPSLTSNYELIGQWNKYALRMLTSLAFQLNKWSQERQKYNLTACNPLSCSMAQLLCPSYGRFASSVSSSTIRLWNDRSFFIVADQEVWSMSCRPFSIILKNCCKINKRRTALSIEYYEVRSMSFIEYSGVLFFEYLCLMSVVDWCGRWWHNATTHGIVSKSWPWWTTYRKIPTY